jgi:hypothetical protein
MSSKEKFPRITITLPPDLLSWVKEKEAILNAKDRRMKTSVSAIIADAVDEMKKREEQGKAASPEPAGVNVLKASKSSVSLRSTATKGNIRQAG